MGGQDIRVRTFQYALRAVRLYEAMCRGKHPASIVLGKQFLRAATSVGANLEEAYAAQSRRDFLHKCRIALKEARESHYWLRLTRESDIVAATKLDDLVSETNEIVAVLTTIVKKTAHNLDEK